MFAIEPASCALVMVPVKLVVAKLPSNVVAVITPALAVIAVPTLRVVPSNVRFALPSNAPSLLYWTWVLEPPGLPPPIPPHDGVDPL